MELFKPAEAAALSGCKLAYIRNLKRRGLFRSEEMSGGKHSRFTKAEINALWIIRQFSVAELGLKKMNIGEHARMASHQCAPGKILVLGLFEEGRFHASVCDWQDYDPSAIPVTTLLDLNHAPWRTA